MNSKLIPRLPLLTLLLGLATSLPASALSRSIGRDVNFPKDHDPAKAKALLAVVQDERFQFVEGMVSYWPPDWGTRLSFTGDAASLNGFLIALRGVPGAHVRVLLYRGRSDEVRRDSPWQLDFSQAHPDRLTVYLTVNSADLELDKVELPLGPTAANGK